jgi:predicted dehydrogenase
MAGEQVRVAVVGCGDHGRGGHLKAYRQLIEAGEPAQVVAVCDRDAERARETAEEFGVSAWYTDHQEMLRAVQPDAVSIATPPLVHKQQTLDALAAGAHVLCEKPLAMNVAEGEEMVAAAVGAAKVLSMGLQNRYSPAARYLRDVLAGDGAPASSESNSGELPDIGTVYHTRVWCGHILRLPPSRHFFQPELAGGGVIAATAVHILDAALWMLHNPPIATVSASTFARAPRMPQPPPPFGSVQEAQRDFRVEDFAYGMVRFAGGSTMSIEANWFEHPTKRSTGIQFLGTAGVAEYGPLAIRLDDGKTAQDLTPGPDVVPQRGGHYFLEVARDFLQAARTGTPTVITGLQMLQVQRLMDRLYESARERREVAF